MLTDTSKNPEFPLNHSELTFAFLKWAPGFNLEGYSWNDPAGSDRFLKLEENTHDIRTQTPDNLFVCVRSGSQPGQWDGRSLHHPL